MKWDCDRHDIFRGTGIQAKRHLTTKTYFMFWRGGDDFFSPKLRECLLPTTPKSERFFSFLLILSSTFKGLFSDRFFPSPFLSPLLKTVPSPCFYASLGFRDIYIF